MYRPGPSLDGRPLQRVLGEHDTGIPGPTIVVFGGIHGNEPAGVHSCRQIAEGARCLRRGRLLALAGNLGALSAGVRFRDRDLNRRWTDEGVARIRAMVAGEGDAEDQEQRELLDILEPALERSDGPALLIDLHTTSGPGAPFACMSDTLPNREVALALPMPVILGLEEVIDGSMLGYLSDRGHRGLAIEGGQHESATTVGHHVAAVWIVLAAAGLARLEPDVLEAYERSLEDATFGLPRVVEVRYRHVLCDDEPFQMEPGFVNFDVIREGQVLAQGADGPILAPRDGRMLLPRYQGQGEDGFFVAREVPHTWLGLSSLIRRVGLDRHLSLLPGIQRHPQHPDALIVPRARAEGRIADLLRMGGYRRRVEEGDVLVFSRRRPW